MRHDNSRKNGMAITLTAKALKVPENIGLLYLPSYRPELNAIERLWGAVKVA